MERTVAGSVDTGLRQRITQNMFALLPRVLRRDLPDVSEASRLMEDLGMTSSTMLELLLELEESLEVEINVEDIDESVNTVGVLADFVATHLVSDE